MEGYLSIVRLFSEELRLKDHERHKSFKEAESPSLAQQVAYSKPMILL